ncbi:MAG: Rap1a/Tai family immunity protein [Candidatus Binatia bacterium]|nr:Rap1a/Tai family immunity protein [Candidatus Binatia bacterium]
MKRTYSRMAAALFVALLASPTAAQSGYKDGNELYAQLQAGKRMTPSTTDPQQFGDAMYGTGYVMGVVDGLNGVTSSSSELSKFCIPDGVAVKQLTDVTFLFLEKYPERRHFPAAWIVALALSEKFPCAKK